MSEDDKSLIDVDAEQGLSMGAKLLLELRQHRVESKAQFARLEERLDDAERQLEKNSELGRQLAEELNWGKGVLKGIFWIGSAALAIWGVFTGWVKLFPPGN